MLGYAFAALAALFYILTANVGYMGIEFVEKGAWPFGVMCFIGAVASGAIAFQCGMHAVDELK